MRVRTYADFGLIVRSYRKQRGLSQAELARRAGVSRQWLVNFEGGKSTAELSLALRVVGAVGLEVDVTPSPPPDTLLDDLLADLSGPEI